MRADELIDILRDYPAEAEVELAIVAPILEENDEITVDRFEVAGVMPWTDDDGTQSLWLISSERDEDVDTFLDALDDHDDDDHDHDHDHEH